MPSMELLDIMVSGVPVRLLHFIYPFIFSGTYAVFTGIYFAAGGVNNINGKPYIYPVLNYGENPGVASAYVLVTVLVLIPLLHLLTWALYLLREGLLYLFKHICFKQKHNTAGDKDEMKEPSDEADDKV